MGVAQVFVGKIFVYRLQTTKSTKILPLENYPLYTVQCILLVSYVSMCADVLSQPTSTPSTDPSEVCGGPGWRKVAFMDMKDPNQNCPQGLTLTNYPEVRSCGRTWTGSHRCPEPILFPVGGSQYSQVCGRATAYRWGWHFGFNDYLYGDNRLTTTIDDSYVDGLSLTHGSPRSNIWSFASGWFSGSGADDEPWARCPCDPGNPFEAPEFVGNDYFCESVETVDNFRNNTYRFYPENALWDGQDLLNPCYGNNNAPWFIKTLPAPTTDDIELRLCTVSHNQQSNFAIERLEIFVNS